jgi:hypothetical protein
MISDWADELGDGWVTISPGIYIRVEDLKAEPVPKLRIAESAAGQADASD